jgi:quinoprotein glucose dehydrogenase
VQPERGLTEAIALSASTELPRRQAGYRHLGTTSDPKATEFLKSRLIDWKSELPGALLDLLTAASTPQHPSLAPQLAAYEASLDANDPLAAFQSTLQGGSSERGRDLFITHAAGQCSKCHKVGGDGGIAGPDLTGIGSRHDAIYLLGSLVAPSSVVVPGYGITLVTLKGGETLGGTFLSENANEIRLKLPDPNASGGFSERVIPLSDIESRQPPISAMPPMGALLTKAEIRDLVAFLASLKENDAKKGH